MPCFSSGRKPRAAVLSSVAVVISQLPSIGLADTVYRWVDKNGKTHYSDRAITDREIQRLDAATLGRINLQQGVTVEPRSARSRSSRQTVARTGKRHSKLDKDCQRYRTNILSIEQRLRQGYSEPAGSKLRLRKKKWSNLLYQKCF